MVLGFTVDTMIGLLVFVDCLLFGYCCLVIFVCLLYCFIELVVDGAVSLGCLILGS